MSVESGKETTANKRKVYIVMREYPANDCHLHHVFWYSTPEQERHAMQGFVEGTLLLVAGVIEVQCEAGQFSESGQLE